MAVDADVYLSFQIMCCCCCSMLLSVCFLPMHRGSRPNTQLALWSGHRVPLCYVMVLYTGTNLWDAQQTVDSVLEDFPPAHVPLPLMQEDDLSVVLQKGGVPFVDLQGYTKIDKHEIDQGQKVGKPREKLVSTEEMLQIAASS